jgi:hypothetical protein
LGTTTNLGLTTYSVASGSVTTFQAFRTALDGTTSNMSLIDDFAGNVSGSISAMKTGLFFPVNGLLVSANTYAATGIAGINNYFDSLTVNLSVDTANTGPAVLNINSLGNVQLTRANTTGSIINLAANDLIPGRYRLFIYSANNNNFVLSANDLSVSGSINNFVSIGGSGIPQDSGYSFSSFVQVSGSTASGTLSGSNVWTGTNQFNGATGNVVTNITGSLVLNSSHHSIYADATSGAISVTLPSASGITGRRYEIMKIDSSGNTVTIVGTINGVSNKILSSQYATATVEANTNWYLK